MMLRLVAATRDDAVFLTAGAVFSGAHLVWTNKRSLNVMQSRKKVSL